MRPMPFNEKPVIIVGAGVFGLSLAYELATHRNHTNVTVLDRYLPPAPDGSSVDVSRVIRSDYADPFYNRLSREALEKWREPDSGYAPFYHESGFVMLAGGRGKSYFDKTKDQSAKAGMHVEVFPAGDAEKDIRERYGGVRARLDGMAAMVNARGGWADAEGAVRALAERCSRAGVSFVVGRQGTVTEVVKDANANANANGNNVTGVKTAAGQFLPASTVVLATGAWTNGLVHGFGHAFGGSGQPVGFIQLTPDEAASLMPMPVMIDMDTGVFVFPPTPSTHMLKLARHGFGYAAEVSAHASGADGSSQAQRVVSAPKTFANNAATGFVPEDASEALREGCRRLVPQFADRPWLKARLCWYTDTPECDFVADHHPDVGRLFIAAGGSGHAFKMLPALGKHLADCFEKTAPAEVRQKWRLRPARGSDDNKVDMGGDGSRGGPPLRLLTREEQAKL